MCSLHLSASAHSSVFFASLPHTDHGKPEFHEPTGLPSMADEDIPLFGARSREDFRGTPLQYPIDKAYFTLADEQTVRSVSTATAPGPRLLRRLINELLLPACCFFGIGLPVCSCSPFPLDD